MSNLKLFENPEFGKVRTIAENGKVLFCGSDVAKMLGYKRPADAITAHCKGSVIYRLPTNGGEQNIKFITEGDVIRLVARSPLPGADKFESWIFDEVIPDVLRHGAYMTPDTLEKVIASPEFGIRLLTELKQERDKRVEAEAQKAALEAKVEADRPKVLFAEAVEGSENGILIRELAKLLRQNGVEIGEVRLFQWMREEGYLIRQKGRSYNTPTQRAVEMGVLEIRETVVQHDSGSQTHRTPLVTGKGQGYFINLFLSKKKAEGA